MAAQQGEVLTTEDVPKGQILFPGPRGVKSYTAGSGTFTNSK